ncbi:TPA: hypothetical protein ACGVAX_004436, partial [Vibrio vulnificus]
KNGVCTNASPHPYLSTMEYVQMNAFSQRLMMSLIGLTLTSTAYTSVSLGGGGSGVFAQIANFFQEIVDFLGGTGAMFVIAEQQLQNGKMKGRNFKARIMKA